MGIMTTNDLDRDTELNRRISADLRSRAQSMEKRSDPGFAEDSTYIEGTKKTGKFTWIWIVLIILAIISLICIVVV